MDLNLILVVEDEPDIRELVVHILQQVGYCVRDAPNGQAALAMLADSSVDLVITDVMMPVMTGIDLLKAMGANDSLRGIPTLILSSQREEDVRGQCDAVVSFMQKPFQIGPLLARVAELLTSTGTAPRNRVFRRIK